jgi:hypothetical protein
VVDELRRPAVSFGFFVYSHTPFANPDTHVHWYAWYDTADSVVCGPTRSALGWTSARATRSS